MTTHLTQFAGFGRTTNPALLAALGSLAGYDQTDTADANLQKALSTAQAALGKAEADRASFAAAVTADMQGGGQVPSNLAADLAVLDAAISQVAGQVTLLREIGQSLATGRDQMLMSAPEDLSHHLNGQLQAVLVEARALDLGTVGTAQEAIDAGKVDAWQTYLALSETYTLIRSAQAEVNASLTRDHLVAQLLHDFAAVRNLPAVFPRWYDRQRGVVIGTLNGEPMYVDPPWDEDDRLSLWRYAVQNPGVDLWVPSARQLHETYTEAVAEVRQLENLREREDQGANLTPDERDQLTRHHLLEQQHLNPQGALR